MHKSAVLSPCRKYRYLLERTWNDQLPILAFICLNPSTADEQEDDPTLRRCINFAKSWGYGSVWIGNLFAFRSTAPSLLFKTKKPIGSENDVYLNTLKKKAKTIVFAWGNHGSFMGRDQAVSALFPEAYCLANNKSGQPKHPLYCKADSPLIRYVP